METKFYKSLLSQLKSNIEKNQCFPNLGILNMSEDNSIGFAVIDLRDISDILFSIKKILLSNDKKMSNFAFSIDREATEKQRKDWNLTHNNFVTLYYWNEDSSWSYIVLEYEENSNDFDIVQNDNSYWTKVMKNDLDVLEITEILK